MLFVFGVVSLPCNNVIFIFVDVSVEPSSLSLQHTPCVPPPDFVLTQAAAAAPKLRLVESSRGADPKGLTELWIRLAATDWLHQCALCFAYFDRLKYCMPAGTTLRLVIR